MPIEVRLGDICYPKSKIVVIHANLYGIMNYGYLTKIVKEGGALVERDAKKQAKSNPNLSLGDFFIGQRGRFGRRGVKRFYHLVTRRFPNDLTSLDIIQKGLYNLLKNISEDMTCTVGSLGVECGGIEKKSMARSIARTCSSYAHLDIKIIDEDKEFIEYVKEYVF